MVTLTNVSRASFEFSTPNSPGFPPSTLVRTRRFVEHPDGANGLAEDERRLSGSCTVLPGESVELPDSALDIPQVQAAVAAKILRLVRKG